MKLRFEKPNKAILFVVGLIIMLAARSAYSTSNAAAAPLDTSLALSSFGVDIPGNQELSVSDLSRAIVILEETSIESSTGEPIENKTPSSASVSKPEPKEKELQVASYKVQKGDNLGLIASRNGISVSTLKAFNDMNRAVIHPGQTLKVPNHDGLQVTLRRGQTLSELASQYSVKIDEIVEANGLSDLNKIRAGQKIFLPGSKVAARASRGGSASVSEKISWPVSKGWISSHFGMRRHPISGRRRLHTGLDIAANRGTPIKAIKSGTVIYSGRKGGYGNTVEIKHSNGSISRYAHCQVTLVKRGQRVKSGQLIARVGSTGASTGPHLHLEIIEQGKRKNPMAYF